MNFTIERSIAAKTADELITKTGTLGGFPPSVPRLHQLDPVSGSELRWCSRSILHFEKGALG
ncbi:MAG TPA: hypothetical protein VGO75_05905, partial [Gemmatimonadaceae bacterium]|nr:hypothetical protein [Gemmatimonadaceae bacterium]